MNNPQELKKLLPMLAGGHYNNIEHIKNEINKGD